MREGIVFKFLERIVDIRKHYFKIYNNEIKAIKDLKPFLRREDSLKEHIRKQNKAKRRIKNLIIDPTKIYFSYSKDEYTANYQEFINDPIISKFLAIVEYFVLIPGISELKLTVPEIKIK